MVDFLSINDSDKKLNLVRALIGREQEIHSYDINISNYEAMLITLPTGDWPDLIASYKGVSIDLVPEDLQQNVTDYSFRDRVKALLSTEKLERSKSVRVYEALKAQIPSDELSGLVQQVLAEQTQ
jgi:hypothetical protein